LKHIDELTLNDFILIVISFQIQVAMFGVGIERPPWDSDNKYVPHRMDIYFEDRLNVSSDPKLVKKIINILIFVLYRSMGKFISSLAALYSFFTLTQEGATYGPRPRATFGPRRLIFLASTLPFVLKCGPRGTNKGAMWPADENSCPPLL